MGIDYLTQNRCNLIDNDDNWINTDGDTYVVSKDLFTTYLDEEEPEDAIIDDLWLDPKFPLLILNISAFCHKFTPRMITVRSFSIRKPSS